MHRYDKHSNLTSSKREHYDRVRYQHEYSEFVRSSKFALDQLFKECYSQSVIKRDENGQETIWRNISNLNHLLFGQDWSSFRRNKALKELYDHFFRLEINRNISRPNFYVCVKLCCGEICQPGSSKERDVLLASEAVFNSFDTLHRGMIPWRLFIFYLHFLSEPTLSCEEQLLKVFMIIGSTDGLDSKTARKPTIDLQEMASMLFPLVKCSAIGIVLNALDEAWALVNVSSGGEQIRNTKLSLPLFQKMIHQEVLQTLFKRSGSLWGKGDAFPVTIYRWEEEFYNDSLLIIIRNARREEAIRNKLMRDDCQRQRQVCQCWLGLHIYQKHMRTAFHRVNCMIEMNFKAQGYRALASWKVKQCSACNIQRVGRGFLGRIKARICSMMNESAILIQTHSRMYLARQKLQQLLSVYTSAVIKVQSLIRGTLARRLALNKLMTLVEAQRIENANRMKRYRWERGLWSLTKLQSHKRRKTAVLVVSQLRQQRRREAEVRHAIESRNAAFRRERKLYQRQLEDFYKKMKEDHEANKRSEAKVMQDQIRLRSLQRRLKNEELKSQEPDLIMEEKIATEQWKSDWLAKIEMGVISIREHYAQCMDKPANRSEKKIRSLTKKRIKHRVTEVLARADSKNIPMETKEAKVIAREEILHIIGEEERARLLDQMSKALAKREYDKAIMRVKSETAKKEAHARATVYAVSVIKSACRRWLARKEMRRLCLERYEKKYDGDYHMFYYSNKHTGEVSWTKPKAMGVYDIPVKDEFVVLRDMHDFPYYFNPSTFEIRWIPPLNVEVCGATIEYTWWRNREFPVRRGPCPNFARSSCLNEEDGMRYCQDCFDRLIVPENKP